MYATVLLAVFFNGSQMSLQTIVSTRRTDDGGAVWPCLYAKTFLVNDWLHSNLLTLRHCGCCIVDRECLAVCLTLLSATYTSADDKKLTNHILNCLNTVTRDHPHAENILCTNSCLHTLLPPECNNEVFSKLRKPLKYPVPYSRTKKNPFLNYALAYFQNSKWISVFYSSFYVVNCALCNAYFMSSVLYRIIGLLFIFKLPYVNQSIFLAVTTIINVCLVFVLPVSSCWFQPPPRRSKHQPPTQTSRESANSNGCGLGQNLHQSARSVQHAGCVADQTTVLL